MKNDKFIRSLKQVEQDAEEEFYMDEDDEIPEMLGEVTGN